MATRDKCCSIAPYFEVHDGHFPAFNALCERFVEKTSAESGCLYYGFALDGNEVHCREAYDDADALLAHGENVGALDRGGARDFGARSLRRRSSSSGTGSAGDRGLGS